MGAHLWGLQPYPQQPRLQRGGEQSPRTKAVKNREGKVNTIVFIKLKDKKTFFFLNNKGGKNTQWGKDGLFHQWCWEDRTVP